MASGPSFEVDGDGGQGDGTGVASKPAMAGADAAIEVLEQSKERLNGATVVLG